MDERGVGLRNCRVRGEAGLQEKPLGSNAARQKLVNILHLQARVTGAVLKQQAAEAVGQAGSHAGEFVVQPQLCMEASASRAVRSSCRGVIET